MNQSKRRIRTTIHNNSLKHDTSYSSSELPLQHSIEALILAFNLNGNLKN